MEGLKRMCSNQIFACFYECEVFSDMKSKEAAPVEACKKGSTGYWVLGGAGQLSSS